MASWVNEIQLLYYCSQGEFGEAALCKSKLRKLVVLSMFKIVFKRMEIIWLNILFSKRMIFTD